MSSRQTHTLNGQRFKRCVSLLSNMYRSCMVISHFMRQSAITKKASLVTRGVSITCSMVEKLQFRVLSKVREVT